MIVEPMPFRRLAIAGAFAALIGGCGSISLVKPTPAADIYDLKQSHVSTDGLQSVDWQLIIEEPLAPRVINTDRIMIKPSPHVVQYVSAARWSDRAPDLVHTHLVRAFEDTGLILSVGREVTGLHRDLELKGELRDFHIEDFNGKPSVKVEMSFKLVEYPSASVVDARVFSETREIKAVRMTRVLNGFDEAMSDIINDTVFWVLGYGQDTVSDNRGTAKTFDPLERTLTEVPDSAAEEEVDLPGVGGEEGVE